MRENGVRRLRTSDVEIELGDEPPPKNDGDPPDREQEAKAREAETTARTRRLHLAGSGGIR